VAHAFQAAGFKTAMTGKWHLSSTVETETKGGFTYQVKEETRSTYPTPIPHLPHTPFLNQLSSFVHGYI
jgi:arylsulfatase A-like enzyme